MNGILKQILDELKGLREDLKNAGVIEAKVDLRKVWGLPPKDESNESSSAMIKEEKPDVRVNFAKNSVLILPEKIQIGDTVIDTEKLKPLLVALGTQPIKKLDIEFQTKREYDNLDRRVI
jgi:hypothetical protein